MSAIAKIQKELKAPKGQFNKFGGYKYRSCEDIVEAVKPILAIHNCYLIITDKVVNIGDRYYVKATAKICKSGPVEKPNEALGVLAKATGWAREAQTKKGMDESQITGAASSYARKYALNGLLAIDDTADADTQDNTAQDSPGYHVDIERIAKAKSFDELKTVFGTAYKNHENNKSAIAELTAAKDKRKGELG